MTWANNSIVTEFILFGFSDLLQLQLLLFVIFLIMYFAMLLGNIFIVLLTTTDPALQNPMYFFLRNLSLLELCLTLVIVPKMLVNLLSENKAISFPGCAMQMFFFFFFGSTECFLLATMAYDRYAAICNPLHYTVIMNKRFCVQLALFSWFSGIPVGTVQTTWLFSFPFCGPNEVNHFFCDSPPVLKLVCGDTYLFEIYAITGTILVVLSPFMLILVSYARIIVTILRMPSVTGRHKAFSTCSSHLIVVTLFYGTIGLTYFRPKSSYSANTKKLLSLFYTVFTPMLNPIIYSLRNKEVKGAMRRLWHKKNQCNCSCEP
ncbi:PREDICTED: olfactory receptor 10A4-like [Gekko japonicus]|uniref:Olfactory receptor n=1 Tax=Gekko japonicus TaxID=146911 RepID=A0ABM1K9D4_GEKJA|nr:PREDICTED: olfactory receptor 10A4-like [Gekko japonicus]